MALSLDSWLFVHVIVFRFESIDDIVNNSFGRDIDETDISAS